jgi:hypothetical protein
VRELHRSRVWSVQFGACIDTREKNGMYPIAGMARRVTSTLLFIVLLGSAQGVAAPQAPFQELETFLRRDLAFSSADLQQLRQDRVIAKVVKTNQHEVAAFGIVRIQGPKSLFLEQYRDIVTYKKGKAVPQVGKFSFPPRLEDFQGLTLERQDIDALKNCRVGRCDVKLPDDAIERFRREIDWSAPDATLRATTLLRQIMLDLVNAYLAGGNAGLSEYADKKRRTRIADEFGQLLAQFPYLFDSAPEFHSYLANFPYTPLPNVENFIYWSKENYGLKPVITITHVSIYQPSNDPRSSILIASKQIYATHYFEASLGLTGISDASTGEPVTRFYLMYLNRSRADALRGGFGGLARGIVAGKMRESLRDNLEITKQKIESLYRLRQSGDTVEPRH